MDDDTEDHPGWLMRSDAEQQEDLVVGRIKFYDEDKGFGFISPDQGKGDVFFRWRHKTEAKLENIVFEDGMPIAARAHPTARGLRAHRIWLVK
jgi:cold shock CspA family protein